MSRESEEFLKSMMKERQAPSMSQALESVLREARREHNLRELETAVTHYYDTLTDEQQEEERLWGELATRDFFKENREP